MQMTLEVVQIKRETLYPQGWTEPAEQVVFVTVDVMEDASKTGPSGTIKFKAQGDERIGDRYQCTVTATKFEVVPFKRLDTTPRTRESFDYPNLPALADIELPPLVQVLPPDGVSLGSPLPPDEEGKGSATADGDWPWCDACQSYHHKDNPSCRARPVSTTVVDDDIPF